MHRTYVHDDGKVHEYFFGPMEATKSTVTAYTEVTPTGGRYYVFEDFLANRFTPNTEKKEYSIGSKTFVLDYVVFHTVDLRARKA